MKSNIIWYRLLFLSIGLIFLAAVNLIIVVVPPPSVIPKSAVEGILINVVFQVLIILSLIWIINKRKAGDYKKEMLVISGAIAIIMSLVILDGVVAYYNQGEQHAVSIAMLVTSIFDFLAAVVIFIARYLIKPT